MKMTWRRRFTVGSGGVLSLFLLSACCVGPALPTADSWNSVGAGETIVMGRIVVFPPVDESEQTLKTVKSTAGGLMINPSANEYKNKVILLTDKKMRVITDPSLGDYSGRIEAPLGELFAVAAANGGPLYVVRSEILMDVHRGGAEKALLPSGYKIDIRRGDKAIYIGTIKYHRNEFFEVKKVELIDEYDTANAAFRKKFGSRVKLRKALVTRGEKPASQ